MNLTKLAALLLTVGWFSLTPAGGITFIEAVFDNTNLQGANSVIVSPDGHYLYAAGWADNAVAVFGQEGP